jgi:hypothetical protein
MTQKRAFLRHSLLLNPMCLFFWNLIAALFATIFLCGCTFGRRRLPNVHPHKKEEIMPPLAENKRT